MSSELESKLRPSGARHSFCSRLQSLPDRVGISCACWTCLLVTSATTLGSCTHTEILCGHLAAGHTSSWRFGLFPFSFEVSGLGRCHHLPEEMRTDRFFSIRSISRCRQTVSNAEAPCPEIQPRDRYFLFASEAWKVQTMKHRGGSNTCEEKCGQRSEKRLCECIQASEAGLCTTSVIKLWQTRFSIMEMPRFPLRKESITCEGISTWFNWQTSRRSASQQCHPFDTTPRKYKRRQLGCAVQPLNLKRWHGYPML